MSIYSAILAAMGAASFTVAVSEILIHFRRRGGRSYSLSLGVASLFTCAYCIMCGCQYNVTEAAQSVVWLRGEAFCLSLTGASYLWFISDATGSIPRLHLRIISAWFILCAVVQLLGFGDLTWIVSRPEIKEFKFLGLDIVYREVAAGPFTVIQSGSAVLYFGYLHWRLAWLWRSQKSQTAKALLVVTSITAAAVLSDLAVSLGLYVFPYLTEYAWLAAVLFTGFQKSDLVLQASEAKAALEESEEKFRTLIEQSSEAILLADEEGSVIEYNRAAEILTGIPAAEALGRPVRDVIGLPPEAVGSGQAQEAPVPARASSGVPMPGVSEGSLIRPDGTLMHYRRNTFSINTKKGRRFGVIVHDVTEQKHANDSLMASLQEKNVLLKEIHHRVKNNLQVVSSLLYLQESRAKEPENKAVFRECRTQVVTMALIHEDLYRSADLRSVHFDAYIKRLAVRLAGTFSSAARVAMEFTLDEVPLSIEKAIPCGLILNELCTNAFKHAFPGQKDGPISGERGGNGGEGPRLTIGLKKTDGSGVSLSVWDNGIGLPEGFNFQETRSVGMQIVTTLVHQLRGSIRLEPGRGTRFTVEFDAV